MSRDCNYKIDSTAFPIPIHLHFSFQNVPDFFVSLDIKYSHQNHFALYKLPTMLPSHVLLAIAAVSVSPVAAQFGNMFANMFKQQQQQQQPDSSWIEHTYDNGKLTTNQI